METEQMVAGPELDARVAEVIGWTAYKERRGGYELAVTVAPDKPKPWKRMQNAEANRVRYTQITCGEALAIGFFGTGFPRVSTDWAAAGEVLAWLRQQDADTQQRFYDGLAAQWRQWAAAQETEGMTEEEWCDIHLLTGTSRWFILYADIPLAISLAALEAVKQNQDGP